MVSQAQLGEVGALRNELVQLEMGLKVLAPPDAVVTSVNVGNPPVNVPTQYAVWLNQQMRQVLRSGLWHRANEVINALQNLGVTGLTYLPPPA